MNNKLDKVELDKILTISQLKNEICEFPDKLETMLGERGVNLSGGQKQRLALARALAVQPKILILDDAFSSVDVNTEKKIIKRLKNPTRTTLIISNRLTGITKADHIIVLSHGKIIEEGKHKELIKSKGLYAKIFHLQQMEEKLR